MARRLLDWTTDRTRNTDVFPVGELVADLYKGGRLLQGLIASFVGQFLACHSAVGAGPDYIISSEQASELSQGGGVAGRPSVVRWRIAGAAAAGAGDATLSVGGGARLPIVYDNDLAVQAEDLVAKRAYSVILDTDAASRQVWRLVGAHGDYLRLKRYTDGEVAKIGATTDALQTDLDALTETVTEGQERDAGVGAKVAELEASITTGGSTFVTFGNWMTTVQHTAQAISDRVGRVSTDLNALTNNTRASFANVMTAITDRIADASRSLNNRINSVSSTVTQQGNRLTAVEAQADITENTSVGAVANLRSLLNALSERVTRLASDLAIRISMVENRVTRLETDGGGVGDGADSNVSRWIIGSINSGGFNQGWQDVAALSGYVRSEDVSDTPHGFSPIYSFAGGGLVGISQRRERYSDWGWVEDRLVRRNATINLLRLWGDSDRDFTFGAPGYTLSFSLLPDSDRIYYIYVWRVRVVKGGVRAIGFYRRDTGRYLTVGGSTYDPGFGREEFDFGFQYFDRRINGFGEFWSPTTRITGPVNLPEGRGGIGARDRTEKTTYDITADRIDKVLAGRVRLGYNSMGEGRSEADMHLSGTATDGSDSVGSIGSLNVVDDLDPRGRGGGAGGYFGRIALSGEGGDRRRRFGSYRSRNVAVRGLMPRAPSTFSLDPIPSRMDGWNTQVNVPGLRSNEWLGDIMIDVHDERMGDLPLDFRDYPDPDGRIVNTRTVGLSRVSVEIS